MVNRSVVSVRRGHLAIEWVDNVQVKRRRQCLTAKTAAPQSTAQAATRTHRQRQGGTRKRERERERRWEGVWASALEQCHAVSIRRRWRSSSSSWDATALSVSHQHKHGGRHRVSSLSQSRSCRFHSPDIFSDAVSLTHLPACVTSARN